MKLKSRIRVEDGFSFIELLVAMLVLIPVMGAALSLFSVGTNHHASEQSSVEAIQEARSGLDLMSMEIAQAGSHGDRATVTGAAISPSTSPQMVSVTSSAGFTVGDYVDVGSGTSRENVKVTAVGDNSISAVFRVAHASGVPVRLFALPYLTGVMPPAGLGPDSSATVTTLRFFGDMNGDSNLYYVEYSYDSENKQITRSMTPITQTSKNPALPIVRNIKPDTVEFAVYTDHMGTVTSAGLRMTVQNTWKTVDKYQETALSTRVLIPSAVAASDLMSELEIYGGVNKLPPTPPQVTTWANQYEEQ